MKLKYTFELLEMDEDTIAVPMGEDAEHFQGLVKLNRTASEIFTLLMEEKTIDEIVHTLAEEYGENLKTIEKSVKDYLVRMEADGLICS